MGRCEGLEELEKYLDSKYSAKELQQGSWRRRQQRWNALRNTKRGGGAVYGETVKSNDKP
jgi:hypothetical protein